jgi:hypothetical protein
MTNQRTSLSLFRRVRANSKLTRTHTRDSTKQPWQSSQGRLCSVFQAVRSSLPVLSVFQRKLTLATIELRNKIYNYWIDNTRYLTSNDSPQLLNGISTLHSWIEARALAHASRTLRNQHTPLMDRGPRPRARVSHIAQ